MESFSAAGKTVRLFQSDTPGAPEICLNTFSDEGERGWFLLRMSLHDPILPLNIESDDCGGAKKIAEKVYGFIQRYDQLDIQPLKTYLGL